MKRLLLIVGATALLVAPFRAQAQSAQTQNDMTIPEFRHVLVDLGSYLDAHKGTAGVCPNAPADIGSSGRVFRCGDTDIQVFRRLPFQEPPCWPIRRRTLRGLN